MLQKKLKQFLLATSYTEYLCIIIMLLWKIHMCFVTSGGWNYEWFLCFFFFSISFPTTTYSADNLKKWIKIIKNCITRRSKIVISQAVSINTKWENSAQINKAQQRDNYRKPMKCFFYKVNTHTKLTWTLCKTSP